MDSVNIFSNEISTSDIWTIAVSICAIISIFIAMGMLKATRKYTSVTEDIFLSSHRPYLGRSTHVIDINKSDRMIYFIINVQNYGKIPAKKVDIIVQVFVNDVLQNFPNLESKNQIFFPQQTHPMNIRLGNLLFDGIPSGKLSLKIRTEIKYYGVTEMQYSTSETEIYDHTINSFKKEFGEWT